MRAGSWCWGGATLALGLALAPARGQELPPPPSLEVVPGAPAQATIEPPRRLELLGLGLAIPPGVLLPLPPPAGAPIAPVPAVAPSPAPAPSPTATAEPTPDGPEPGGDPLRSAIKGRLLLPDGSPAAHRLAILIDKRTGKLVGMAPTDEEGNFAFPAHPEGDCWVVLGRRLEKE